MIQEPKKIHLEKKYVKEASEDAYYDELWEAYQDWQDYLADRIEWKS